jgi:hypothetical protein
MNTDQVKGRLAQPADEEIKKHGDQLEKQVRDAAGKQEQEEGKDRKSTDG